MISARMSTLATLRGRIERIEASTGAVAPNRVALGHAEADAVLCGGLAAAAVHEVFAEGHQSTAATGFVAGLSARVSARRPLVWVRQDFCDLEAGALSMSGLAELGLDPRCSRHGARRRCRERAAGRGRCARLRCAGRRGAGSLGAGAAARSGREPQADTGGASLRRHRIAAADCSGAFAFDGRDEMDRARGAFAAAVAVGRLGLTLFRRRANPQPSWPDRAMDHGMEM